MISNKEFTRIRLKHDSSPAQAASILRPEMSSAQFESELEKFCLTKAQNCATLQTQLNSTTQTEENESMPAAAKTVAEKTINQERSAQAKALRESNERIAKAKEAEAKQKAAAEEAKAKEEAEFEEKRQESIKQRKEFLAAKVPKAIKVKAYTPKEADEATARFLTTKHEFRMQLLDLWEHRAHRALGYSDDFSGFCVYATEKLDMNVTPRSIQLQIEAAVVSRNVGEEVSVVVSKHLARLKPAQQLDVYSEVTGTPVMEGRLSANKMEPAIKRLVDRQLGGNGNQAPPATGQRGRPRKSADEFQNGSASAQETRTATPAASEGNSTPSPAPWTIEAFQVEIGQARLLPENPEDAYNALSITYDALNLAKGTGAESGWLSKLFLATVHYANVAGIDIEEDAKSVINAQNEANRGEHSEEGEDEPEDDEDESDEDDDDSDEEDEEDGEVSDPLAGTNNDYKADDED